MTGPSLLAISVGNTRTALGAFRGGQLIASERVDNDDRPATLRHAEMLWESIDGVHDVANDDDGDDDGEHFDGDATIVIASVNDAVGDPLRDSVKARLGQAVWRVGDEVPIPIGTQLDPETIVGIDRLLNAAAAWDRLQSACVVVDAGTAITVDFVDGVGIFQGGAIAPGARMQLMALHERTHGLPLIELAAPDPEAFGKNTRQAMLNGVVHGIRGMVWRLMERYAESYGAFPPVLATGGDAPLLFAGDELVNVVVPDLTLLGISVAVRAAAARDESDSGA